MATLILMASPLAKVKGTVLDNSPPVPFEPEKNRIAVLDVISAVSIVLFAAVPESITSAVPKFPYDPGLLFVSRSSPLGRFSVKAVASGAPANATSTNNSNVSPTLLL